jgi:chitin synthase
MTMNLSTRSFASYPMADARRVYRYVQGTSAAPSAYDDDDDYRDYEEDYDDDEYDPQGPLPPSGHSPSGSSKTLQYAAASAGHSPSGGGSKTLQFAMASSSRPPGIPTFDTITEAVNKLQSRYSSPSSSIPNAAPSHPTVREPTPPYERPPSTASSASSFTVATDYAAPLKINQADRFQFTTRPLSQQPPPSLPTIDSGQPLQWDTLDFIEEQDDPFSDRPPSRQRATPPYPFQTHQRHYSDSSSSRSHAREIALAGGINYPPRPPSQLSAASSRSAGSTHRGPSPAPSAGPPILQVMQLHSPSQEEFIQPTVGLISRPGSAQQPPYNPFHSQALTPPANRMLQRRSPAKALSPIDHFRHDTEAYASGRDSLPAFATPHSRSPTPAPPDDDGYEAVGSVNGHFTGTTYPADTHYTGSQYTEETEGIDGGEDDGESTDGEEGDSRSKKEKEKPKSKFQEYLAKARTQALLDPEPEEKPTPQNIFADPRRVVFPTPKSMMLGDSDVPGTPLETRHFGPAPTGRVARRNKTTKRVPLTNGNLVLDLPVPPKLVLPRVGHPEVMKTRYTAVTCDPDDFENSGHFLRQNQMSRRTELFICITMYNVSPFLCVYESEKLKWVLGR